MANKSYLVELTPIGNYFFGSENTFNSTDKATNNTEIQNYLVRSRMYPQQTTILGLMRYVILLKEGKLNGSLKEKNDLVGSRSFQGIDFGCPEKWGMINSISPLFLIKDNNKYTISGQDHQNYTDTDGKNKPKLLKLENEPRITFSYNKNSHLYFPDYNPKQEALQLWKNVLKDEYLSPNDVFVESFQVGIKKSRMGKSDNDAFYKQYFYKLKSGISFAFYLNIEGEIKNAPSSIIVPAGADQSLFNVSFKEENSIFIEQNPTVGAAKFTLISDAYIKPEILDSCFLAISSSVDFRYIKTTTSTKRYYNISNKDDDMKKSGKHNLLERGSVLFTENPDELLKALKEPIAYRNAGFNYFKIESLTI